MGKPIKLTFTALESGGVDTSLLYQDLKNIVSTFQKQYGTIKFTADTSAVAKSLQNALTVSAKTNSLDQAKSIKAVTVARQQDNAVIKESAKQTTFMGESWTSYFERLTQNLTQVSPELLQMREYYSQLEQEGEKAQRTFQSNSKLFAEGGTFNTGSSAGLTNSTQLQEYSAARAEAEKLMVELQQLGDNAPVEKLNEFNNEVSRLPSLLSKARSASTNLNKVTNASVSWDKLAARAQAYYLQVQQIVARNPLLAAQLQEIIQKIRGQDFESVQEGQEAFLKLQQRIRDAGLETESLGQKLTRAFKEKFIYIASMFGVNLLRDGLRQVYENVVAIDTAMTELKKVTDETDSTYRSFLSGAADRAQALGATITDVVNATADYARLGYSLSEATQLSNAAIMYKNVGDDVASIDDATKSLISTMQGFGLGTDQMQRVVDVFNEVSNNYAVSAGDIGEGMQRSSAAMAEAGNSFEQAVALFTGANTVVQDADTVGTALKTMSMRLRSSKTAMESAGEDTDGMADSVSKLRNEIKSLSGVDIMIDDQTFKSSYDMLRDLSKVWKDLTDVSQANVLELLFGKRQANIGAAILSDFSVVENSYNTALNSSGSAEKENQRYLDSIQGKLNQLSATFQSLSENVLDSNLVKFVLDVLNGILKVADSMAKIKVLIPAIAAGWALIANNKSASKPKMKGFNMPAKLLVVTRNELAA